MTRICPPNLSYQLSNDRCACVVCNLGFGIISPSLAKSLLGEPEHAKFNSSSSSLVFDFQEKEKRFYYGEFSVTILQ